MPVTTTNQRAEIATVAAQNNWTARDYSLPRESTAGAVVKVVFIRGQFEEVTIFYNAIDKMVTAVARRGAGKDSSVYTHHRLATVKAFMAAPEYQEDDNLEIRTMRDAVTALRDGVIVATADTNVLEGANRRWFVRKEGKVVAMIGADDMPEPDMRRAVLAVVKAIA